MLAVDRLDLRWSVPVPQAPLHPCEKERIQFLHRLNVLDTSAEPALDRIAQKLARKLGTPIALISLVDHHNGHSYWTNNNSIKFLLGVITNQNVNDYNWIRDIEDWSAVPFDAFLLSGSNNTAYQLDFERLHSLLLQKNANVAFKESAF